ncbi:hypothetical protein PsYK624_043120 [Phanerochaete sordida]|uniref:Uncharacterized protein n=1 Tax=Phanerochaete sordida TaxID=48140 RepID=A0A9P3G5H0_9APHY|nr:hypothetical protein PsYK624_043120 [Phanerochaete sordida]
METSPPPAGLTALQASLWQHILEHPGEECFRPLLGLTGDYRLTPDGDTPLQFGENEPNPENWRHFLSPNLAGNINTLRLDLATVRNRPVWDAIVRTAPASFPLPQLHTLHISMDQVPEQIDFACRFIKHTVHDLTLLIFPTHRRMAFRSDTPRDDYRPIGQIETFLDDVRHTWYPEGTVAGPSLPLERLYECVQLCTETERLQFVVSDVKTAYNTYTKLVDMVRKLRKLRTLVLARHTACAPILCLLSSLPALQYFGAFQAEFPLTAVLHREYDEDVIGYYTFWNLWGETEDQRTQQSVVNIQKPMRKTLTALTLEIDPAQFLTVAQKWTEKEICCEAVTRLYLHCSTSESGIQEEESEAHDLLALLPGIFPALRELRVGPLRWNGHSANEPGTPRFCVTAAALRALVPLPALEVLTLDAAYAPCVSAAEWAEVLPSWPRLRVLRLPSTQALYVRAPTVPLDTLLCVFERHCPQIEELYVAASAAVAGPQGTWRYPPALRELSLAHGHMVPDVERFDACLQPLAARGGAVWTVPLYHYDERPRMDWEAIYFNVKRAHNRAFTASITGVGLDQALADEYDALAPWRITI